jgi:hypothetical protein
MFREMLIKGHNARAPHKGELWCNVLGEYLEPCMIGSFQFFPYRLGEDIMQKVFGLRSANELYSPRNGLLMDKRIRQYFYEFSIVIVPIGAPTDGCWRTVVLDKRLLKEHISEGRPQTFAAIDGKPVTFKGNARPAARYAYFHYAVAIMKAAAEKKLDGLSLCVRSNCWTAATGRYFVLDGLVALIEHIGHCTLRELPELENHFYTESSWKTGGEKAAAELVADVVKKRMDARGCVAPFDEDQHEKDSDS